MTEPLRMGATIGILGGGQLGRMLSNAASRLGFRTHVFDCLLYTSPSPRDQRGSRMPSSA